MIAAASEAVRTAVEHHVETTGNVASYPVDRLGKRTAGTIVLAALGTTPLLRH